jgi:uncharacterized repeat protein (TIGR03803 family)
MTPAGTLTTLVNFNSTNGANPYGSLIQGSDGNFYGTVGGISHDGAIFKMTPGGILTTLLSFPDTNGPYPQASLIQGSDGNFYGTTNQGGSSAVGTIFKATTGGTLTTLYSFITTIAGYPNGLIQGSDGNFYGTTSSGNTGNSIFKMTPGGALSTLASLDKYNLLYPNGGLVQGSDGNFYGTTNDGDGSNGNGKIFGVTPTGTVITLFSFNHTNGAVPEPGLVQGIDGEFYGTTKYGGASGDGTAFKITPAGTLTTLVSFNNNSFPGGLYFLINGAMVQGMDDNFYGTIHGGNGSIFKMTPAGALTNLFTFNSTIGSNPSSLIKGNDGNFYCVGQGANTGFTSVAVFKLTPAGTLTTLVTASDSGGYSAAYAPLTQGSDGNFYGTTQYGGNPLTNYGTIFMASPSGTLTTFAPFNGNNGSNPQTALVQGNDGNFYGVANGGSAGVGVIFCLNPSSFFQASFTSSSDIPLTTSDFTLGNTALNLILSYAPIPGITLTVINNTGTNPIHGTFSNLSNGGTINSIFNGVTYTFTANYEAGDGNDLTLRAIQTFSQWEAQYSLTGGATATPQHDGVPNLLKYVFDINPSVPMSTSDRAALPAFKIPSGTSNLTLAYRQNQAMTGITVNVQTSPDLITWTTVQNPTITQTGTDPNTGDPLMLAQIPATGTREFIRLNITTL